MANNNKGVGGGGGPLIVLQATAVPHWQGASDYEDSLMAGGDVETDYDLICGDGQPPKGVFVLTRYGREMLVLWQGAFGGRLLPPQSLSLPPSTIIVIQGCADDDLPDILPKIQQRVHRGRPDRSLLLNIQDTTLRLQAGADNLQIGIDGVEPQYGHGYLDIPVSPGSKQCEVYEYDNASFKDEFVIINTPLAD